MAREKRGRSKRCSPFSSGGDRCINSQHPIDAQWLSLDEYSKYIRKLKGKL